MKSVRAVYNYFLDFQDSTEKEKEIPEGRLDGNDNDRCRFYQSRYLKHGDSRAFLELWKLFTLLCKKAVVKEMRTKRFFLDSVEIDYKADIACEYVMRRYQSYKREKGENYVITNFIASAHSGAVHALYNEEENDYFLDMCKELSGKPLKEAERRGAKNTEKIIRLSGATSRPEKSKKPDTQPELFQEAEYEQH